MTECVVPQHVWFPTQGVGSGWEARGKRGKPNRPPRSKPSPCFCGPRAAPRPTSHNRNSPLHRFPSHASKPRRARGHLPASGSNRPPIRRTPVAHSIASGSRSKPSRARFRISGIEERKTPDPNCPGPRRDFTLWVSPDGSHRFSTMWYTHLSTGFNTFYCICAYSGVREHPQLDNRHRVLYIIPQRNLQSGKPPMPRLAVMSFRRVRCSHADSRGSMPGAPDRLACSPVTSFRESMVPGGQYNRGISM